MAGAAAAVIAPGFRNLSFCFGRGGSVARQQARLDGQHLTQFVFADHINVARSLLAWRGLGNSVVIAKPAGDAAVRMPHQNDISARRLNQLFIPGLNDLKGPDPAISLENVFHLNPKESAQGFLYL